MVRVIRLQYFVDVFLDAVTRVFRSVCLNQPKYILVKGDSIKNSFTLDGYKFKSVSNQHLAYWITQISS